MSFAFFGLFYVEGDAPYILLALTYIHTCSFLSFTIWVWATAPTFDCANLVHLVVFGRHVRVTGWIRYIVLILLSLWALGVAIASILGALYWLARQPTIHRLSSKIRNFEAVYLIPPKDPKEATTRNERVLGGAFTSFAFLIFGLVMAELMISSHEVIPSDGNPWGFGQIVAMILLLTPAFTLVRVIREDYFQKSTKSLDQRPLASLWWHLRQRGQEKKAQGASHPGRSAVAPEINTAKPPSVVSEWSYVVVSSEGAVGEAADDSRYLTPPKSPV